jgi:hypothetical protein
VEINAKFSLEMSSPAFSTASAPGPGNFTLLFKTKQKKLEAINKLLLSYLLSSHLQSNLVLHWQGVIKNLSPCLDQERKKRKQNLYNPTGMFTVSKEPENA